MEGAEINKSLLALKECLAPDTLVALHAGGAIRAADVRPGMQLIGGHSEPVTVLSAETPAAKSPAMYQLSYPDGHHLVTPNHLVTLRWGANPTMDVVVENGENLVQVAWMDEKAWRRRHRRFPIEPNTSVADARAFGWSWLLRARTLGTAHPLFLGDLFDVRADELSALMAGQDKRQLLTLPKVCTDRPTSAGNEPTIDQADSLPFTPRTSQDRCVRLIQGVEGEQPKFEYSSAPPLGLTPQQPHPKQQPVECIYLVRAAWGAHARGVLPISMFR